MNKLLLFLTLTLSGLMLPNSDPRPSKFEITHYNITFAPDLSNRVNPAKYARALQDVTILSKLTENLYPSILKQGRSEQQRDKFRVDFINKGLIGTYNVQTQSLSLDFGRFGTNQLARINYIKRRNNPAEFLQRDIARLNSEFSRIYNVAKTQNFGADVWTYLKEFEGERVLQTENGIQDDAGNTYFNKYKNILIITTDGYIEAGIYGQGYDLSQRRVDDFRNAFISSGEQDLEAYFRKRKDCRIKPVQNKKLKNVEVLVMELFDRSRSRDGRAMIHPTDLDILKLFWADWLKQSGVKRYELQPCADSKEEAEKTILNFLGVTKKTDASPSIN
ncbi:hypothetical protein [Mucilaginibacter terrenus]|nr:hypothetical protein [Mucilaginibacter terrenus]